MKSQRIAAEGRARHSSTPIRQCLPKVKPFNLPKCPPAGQRAARPAIGMLSDALMDQVCRAAAGWLGQFTLAFNISPSQLNSHPEIFRALPQAQDRCMVRTWPRKKAGSRYQRSSGSVWRSSLGCVFGRSNDKRGRRRLH